MTSVASSESQSPQPSVSEIRAVCQPPEIRNRHNSEHWLADVYHRRVSPYLTLIALRLNLSANAVTMIMIVTGWLAAAVLLVPGLPGALLAAIFAQLQMIIDCSDGEVARWNRSQSPVGVFLDKIAHYTTEAAIAVALGFRAAGEFDINSGWVFAGLLLAIILLLNKSLNDFVHVARAYAGLPKLVDSASASAVQPGAVATARRIARLVPFYRMFHSIEMTLFILIAAVIDLALGDLVATRVLLAAMLPLATLATVGHFIAIMSSRRLKAA